MSQICGLGLIVYVQGPAVRCGVSLHPATVRGERGRVGGQRVVRQRIRGREQEWYPAHLGLQLRVTRGGTGMVLWGIQVMHLEPVPTGCSQYKKELGELVDGRAVIDQ